MTCSLASTVAQSGHQFTLLCLRKARPLLQHAQEKPLRPTVVVGQAGGDFGLPVVAQPQPPHLAAHVGDVLERPLAGRGVVLERRIFRRESKGIPAHGMEDVVALHPHVARQGIADGVVAHVAHVQLARGIGQHLQHVILGPAAVLGLGAIEIRFRIPALLPAHFDLRRIVANLVRGGAAGGEIAAVSERAPGLFFVSVGGIFINDCNWPRQRIAR